MAGAPGSTQSRLTLSALSCHGACCGTHRASLGPQVALTLGEWGNSHTRYMV